MDEALGLFGQILLDVDQNDWSQCSNEARTQALEAWLKENES